MRIEQEHNTQSSSLRIRTSWQLLFCILWRMLLWFQWEMKYCTYAKWFMCPCWTWLKFHGLCIDLCESSMWIIVIFWAELAEMKIIHVKYDCFIESQFLVQQMTMFVSLGVVAADGSCGSGSVAVVFTCLALAKDCMTSKCFCEHRDQHKNDNNNNIANGRINGNGWFRAQISQSVPEWIGPHNNSIETILYDIRLSDMTIFSTKNWLFYIALVSILLFRASLCFLPYTHTHTRIEHSPQFYWHIRFYLASVD